MSNIININPHIKTLKEIEIKDEIDSTDSYKHIYKLLQRITTVNEVISLVSKAMYYKDYKDKGDLYITLHASLKALAHLMNHCSEETDIMRHYMKNIEYEQISKQADAYLTGIMERENKTSSLQFYIRSLRGEEIII